MSTPTSAASEMLCQNTKRRITPSLPCWLVATDATTMLWASIILPITPPELFADAISVGLRPSLFAVMTCWLPNNAFEPASVPVNATPIQPIIVPKNGYSQPVLANAKPRVPSMPPYRVIYPSASMARMVSNEYFMMPNVSIQVLNISLTLSPITKPAMIAAIRMPVPVAEMTPHFQTAGSTLGAATAGSTRCTRLCSPGICHSQYVMPFIFRNALITGRPHRNNTTVKMTHGVQALITRSRLCPWCVWAACALGTVTPAPEASSMTDCGFQIFRNTASVIIEIIAPSMSTSHGP